MRRNSKRVLIAGGGAVILLITFWLALSVVYAIPSSWMEKQLVESKIIMEKESPYPSMYARQGEKGSYDNFTVYYMLNIASQTGKNPFLDSLESRQYRVDGNPSEALGKAIAGEESNSSYSRYWHGYLVFLKPLLLFLNVVQIRLLAQVSFFVLLSLVVDRLARHRDVGVGAGVILTASYCLFGAAQAAETLPVFPSFTLSLAGCLWAIHLSRIGVRTRIGGVFTEWYILFCSFGVLGALTTYFDFLDNPVLTLGVPLALYLYLERYSFSMGRLLKVGAAATVGWILGYSLLWLGKWLLAEAVAGIPSLSMAIDRVLLRSGISDPETPGATGALKAIAANISALGFMRYAHVLVGLCAFSGIGLFVVRMGPESGSMRSIAVTCFGLLLVSLLPYIWYMAASNHSIVHANLMAYRTQIVAFYSWAMAIYLTVGYTRYNLKNKRHRKE